MVHGLVNAGYSMNCVVAGSNFVTLQRHQSATQTLSFLSMTMPEAKALSVGNLYREISSVVRSHLAISFAQERDVQTFCLESIKGVFPCGGRLASGLSAPAPVVRPGGRPRVHFADLQAPRVHVPNIPILAEVRVVEAALAARERWNVVLDKHRLAQRFFVDGLIGNRPPALFAFLPE